MVEIETQQSMKVIAFYLPQYHVIPENEKWWGEGFTEWTNVKKARPLFDGHDQPRVPLKQNYYDLTNPDTLKWQAELAKQYNIYGFCFYHYWFDDGMLLERPAEILLEHIEIDTNFCFCWANENWTKAWADRADDVIKVQSYSDRDDWEKHFYYLLPFFRDKRYIRIDNIPLFIIYRPEIMKHCGEILTLWQKLALQNGLGGIKFAYQQAYYNHRQDKENGDMFDYGIEYQPVYAMGDYVRHYKHSFKRLIRVLARKLLGAPYYGVFFDFDYDKLWRYILKRKPIDDKMVPGAFVDWDNTPRKSYKGSLCVGVTPEKFKKYFALQLKRAKEVYHKDMIFVFAWNEWGEGGYLEPDEKYGYKMLEAIKESVDNMVN